MPDSPPQQQPLRKQVALVTGATGGIGYATARALAAAGAHVAVGCRTRHRAEALARELELEFGVAGLPIELDVTNSTSVENMSEKLLKKFRRIDIIVNAAGVMHMDQMLDAPLEAFTETLTTNVGGPFLVVRALVEEMISRKRGLIVNVAGMAGVSGAPFLSAYCASKAALISLTQSWAREMADDGVRVVAVCPDIVDTPLVRDILKVDGVPMLAPEAVAARIVALATGEDGVESGGMIPMEAVVPTGGGAG
ncbi:MAG: SDR family oxidoreductase [Nitrospirota bacterium]|nr:SDR family oxidoreductase [Nitrospirota bacterium]